MENKINIIFENNKLKIVNELNYDISFESLIKKMINAKLSKGVNIGHTRFLIDVYSFRIDSISVIISNKYFKKLLKCKNQKSADKMFEKLYNYVQKRYSKFKKLENKYHKKSFEINIEL